MRHQKTPIISRQISFAARALTLALGLAPACAEATRQDPLSAGGAGGAGGTGGDATSSGSMSPPVCGNGLVEAGETCDTDCIKTCPEDGDACTEAILSGDSFTCDVVCTSKTILLCSSGDGCCPAGCTAPEDADCEPCDVQVPKDAPTIAEGIFISPSPGVVCVSPGTFAEEITLRPHVTLRGSGEATRIIGHISTQALPDPDAAPTILRDFRIESDHGALITTCPPDQSMCLSYLGVGGQNASLFLQRVVMAAEQGPNAVSCLELETYGGSTSLTISDSKCISNAGIRFVNIIQDAPVTTSLLVQRSRFEPLDPAVGIIEPIYLLVMSASGDCGLAQVPAGTRVNADIQNNEFFRTKFAGVHVARCLAMTMADAAQSNYFIVNNTFLPFFGASGNETFAIWAEGDIGLLPRLRVVNNLFFATNPMPIGGEPADVDTMNLSTNVSPFVDVMAGNLRLAPGTAPIDIASALYAPKDDKQGLPRPMDGDGDGLAVPDIGAHEFTPKASKSYAKR